MKTKRSWTRAEKSLFLAPLLFAAAAGGFVLWQRRAPVVFTVAGANSIKIVEWSPDGRRLVAFSKFWTGASSSGGVVTFPRLSRTQGMVFDVASRAKICDLRTPPSVVANQPIWFSFPSWSPDGERIAVGFNDGTRGTLKAQKGSRPVRNFVGKIAVWDARNGDLNHNWLYAPLHENSAASVYFSSDGKQLIGNYRPPAIFDARSGVRLQRFQATSMFGTGFNAARTLMVFGGGAKYQLEVHETKTGKAVWLPQESPISDALWNRDNVLAANVRAPNRLLLWNGTTRHALPSPPLHRVSSFGLSRSGPLVAIADVEMGGYQPLSSTSTGNLVVWNYRLNREVWRRKMSGRFDDLNWSRDSKWLSLKQTALEPGNRVPQSFLWVFGADGQVKLRREISWLRGTRWSPDSQQLAVYGENRIEIVRVVD